MRRRSAMTLGLLFAGLSALGLSHEAAGQGSGMVTLSDGTNIENFDQAGNANWRVGERTIYADRGNGFLVTKQSYGDFRLRAEVWVDDIANSGIFIRCDDPEEPGAVEPPEAESKPAGARSKLDMIRGAVKGVSESDPAAAAGAESTTAPEPVKATGKPAAKPAKKIKTAEARPSLRWLGDDGLKELRDRLNAEFGDGTATIIMAGLLIPAERLRDVGSYLRDRNPIRYDYLASLQSVHYEDCIEVNYQLDSTTKPGSLIELRVRTAEAEGEGEVPSVVSVWRGADFQEREVYDMMGVRFAGHPELKRILMWDGFAWLLA